MRRGTPSACLLGLLAVLVGADAAAAGKGAAGPKVWAWASRAVGQHVAGDLGGAVTSLAQARRLQPLAELDALVGLVALEGGKRAVAERQLRRAIERGSREPLVFYWSGRVALVRGRRAEADQRLAQARALGGDRPLLLVAEALLGASAEGGAGSAPTLARVAAAHPNLLDPALYPRPVTGAIELLGVLLKRLPLRRRLWRTLGHLHLRAGNPLAAGAYFQRVVAADPRDADGLASLARCVLDLGLGQRALALAERALAAAPGLARARGVRGEVRRQAGDPRRALADLRAAADGAPRDARVLTLLAETCAEVNDKACAERFFRHAVRRAPTLAAARFGLGLLQQQGNRLGLAERSLLAATRLDPGRPRYHEAAAHFYRLRGDRRAARRMLRAARRAKPLFVRFRAARSRATDLSRRVTSALYACGCPLSTAGAQLEVRPGRCAAVSSGRCATASAALPGVLRRAFSTHRRGRGPAPRPGAGALRRLLLGDATIINYKGKSDTGGGYALRARVPLVPLRRLLGR